MASTALGVSKSSAKAVFTAALVWLSLGGEMRNKLVAHSLDQPGIRWPHL